MKMDFIQFLKKNANSSFKSFFFLTCFFFASTLGLYAQTKTISGTVTDRLEEPLIGVSVAIVGTTTGTVTDIDGHYSIQATEGQTLEFTYVGMETTRASVGSLSTINIVWYRRLGRSCKYLK